jgi:3-deoxy-D-manno-octulosonic-acid transferase
MYTALLTTALVAGYGPVALTRRVLRGVPVHLRDRLALVGGEPGTRSGWVHAVSVGEAIAAAPLVAGLRRLHADLPLVMTTVTATGARVVRERYAGQVTHRFFPVDLPGAVRRAVTAIDPAFLVSMETELWPNLFRHLASRGVPVMIANGRLSDRSYPRYRLARPFMRTVLDGVTVFAMQSDEDARRIISLGARPERVFVTGNLKHEPLADRAGAVELWRHLFGLRVGQPVWIAGSTHRGEEEIVLDAHRAVSEKRPDVVLVLAPRHPERTPDIMRLLATRAWPAVRRTQLERPPADGTVIVLDTVGELAELYALADVVFVGGSLVDAGGHNMLEPAFRGKPVLFGPHTENFREPAGLLLEHGGAIRVADAEAISTELLRLFADPETRARTGRAAYEAAAARQGAVSETLDLVERLIVRSSPR